MKLDDYLLALTASLLAAAEKDVPAALARAQDEFDVHAPRAPKRRSAGARPVGGRELGLDVWLSEARGGRPRAVRVAEGAREERAGLPAFQAAGFAGTGRSLLSIADGPRRGVYALGTLSGPRTAMTPEGFALWLDRQPCRAELWRAVAFEIDRFQTMNGRPGATAETAAGVLRGRDGPLILDFIADNLIKAVQSSVKRAGTELVFAPEERALFESDDPDRMESELAKMSGDGVFVPRERQLRVLGEVSAEELAALIDAQEPSSARAAAWSGAGEQLAFALGREPKDLGDPAAAVRGLPPDRFRMYATMLLGGAQRGVARAGGTMAVPEALRGRVGTDYDALDAEARRGYVPGRERLKLAANPEPWEFYAFVELPGAGLPEPVPLADARRDWRSSLAQAERLARRFESPYAEAFRLAEYALDHADADDAAAAAAGFAENARAVWTRETGSVAELGLPAPNAAALLSASIGDVFGGMGSWNDEAPNSPADAADFERVSSELFVRLRALYCAALSLP